MSKSKTPLYISAALFLAYYLMAPIFSAVLGVPFLGALFSRFGLCCLGLSVVLFLNKVGLYSAVFAAIAAVFQFLPLISYLKTLFGGFSLSALLNLFITLFGFLAFLSVALFSVLRITENTSKILNLWFLPLLFSIGSVLLFAADQTYLFINSEKVYMLLFVQNAVSFITLSAGIAALSFYFKKVK